MGNFININTKMSWFGKKKEEKKEPTEAEKAKMKQMDQEKSNFELRKNIESQQALINKFEGKVADYERKIAEGRQEVKALMGAGKKDKAKRKLKQVKQMEGEITSIQGKMNLIEKQKAQIEAQIDDVGFYDAIKIENEQIAKNQEKQEEMMEQLEKAKELENEAKMNQE